MTGSLLYDAVCHSFLDTRPCGGTMSLALRLVRAPRRRGQRPGRGQL